MATILGQGSTVPSFSAYEGTSAGSKTGAQVITYDTKVFDTHGWLDVTVNKGRYTPKIAGKYLFTACWQYGLSDANNITIGIALNGTVIKWGNEIEFSGGFPWVQSSWILELNGSTDYAEIMSSATSTYARQPEAQDTWVMGTLLA